MPDIFNDEDYVKLPIWLAIRESFTDLINKFNLKGYIVEITPFREDKYQQITEKTPIELFKEEMGLNED